LHRIVDGFLDGLQRLRQPVQVGARARVHARRIACRSMAMRACITSSTAPACWASTRLK
jgi:hypothetical protein